MTGRRARNAARCMCAYRQDRPVPDAFLSARTIRHKGKPRHPVRGGACGAATFGDVGASPASKRGAQGWTGSGGRGITAKEAETVKLVVITGVFIAAVVGGVTQAGSGVKCPID